MTLLDTGLEILWIARYDYDASLSGVPHTHDYTQLVYIIDGEGEILISQAHNHIKKHQLLFIPKGVEHNIESIPNFLKTYNIKFRMCSQLILEKTKTIPPLVTTPASFLADFTNIHSTALEKPLYYREKCQLMITQLLIDIISFVESNSMPTDKRLSPKTQHSPRTQILLDYLHSHYFTPITTHSIENVCFYSYRHVSSFFKKEVGVSPLSYLERLRIEKSQELLKHSEMTIKKVATQVGFRSVHYFTHVFRKRCGIPPATWREKEKSGIGKDIIVKDNFVNNMHFAHSKSSNSQHK